MDLRIPVTVEFGVRLAALAEAPEARDLERDLAAALGGLLGDLGLPGEIAVAVRAGSSRRAVRVWVHGALLSYPPALMKLVWLAVAPDALHGRPAPAGAALPAGFPDDWFEEYASGPAADRGEPGRELAFRFVSELVREVVREYPGALAGPAQVAAYFADDPPPAPLDELVPAFRWLLDAWLPLQDRAPVRQVFAAGRSLGRSAADSAEAVHARLCRGRVEVHVHPAYLQALFPQGPDDSPQGSAASDFLRQASDWLREKTGVAPLELVWQPAPGLPEGTVAVKVNERLRLPLPCARTGEVWIPLSLPEQLEPLGAPVRWTAHPHFESGMATVPASFREAAGQAGLIVSSPLDSVGEILRWELRALADRFLGVAGTEYLLGHRMSDFPELAHAAMARFSPEDLTRVLRGLLREGLPVRDVRAVLEGLLQYDTIPADPERYLLLDDRLPVGEGAAPAGADSWPGWCEFVRGRLKYYLSQECAPQQNVLTLAVSPELQRRVTDLSRGGKGFSPPEQEALRDAVWDGLSETLGKVAAYMNGQGGTHTPGLVWDLLKKATGAGKLVLLTVPGARSALRELLARELPDLPVVTRYELRADLNVVALVEIA